jgi:hypothetical protein
VELVLGHFGADRGQLQDLVPQRPRIVARQGVTTAAAVRGLEGVGVIGRQERPLLEWVAGLAPASAPRRSSWGGAFDGRRIAGGRPRGVGGVLAELFFEIADALLQGGEALFILLEDDAEGRLNSGRDLIPQLRRDRGLRPHAAGVQGTPGSGNPGP